MKPFVLLLTLWAGLAAGARAQQIVRYQGNSKRLFTLAQVDSMTAANNQRLAARIPGMQLAMRVTESRTQGDTLIHSFVLEGGNAAVREANAHYATFIGKPLPEFHLPDLQGRMVSSAALRGKPLVINMWFTACAPCVAEMPALNRIQQANPGVEFLSMTFDPKEKVAEFLQKHAFTFRHVPAARAYCEQFTQQYPLSIFVDKDGVVRRMVRGMPMSYDKASQQATGQVNSTEFEAALRSIQ